MEGKYVIVADDMIASGGSILDTAKEIKKLGVDKIFLVVTFALFTEGVEKFQEYFDKGIIDRVYASNVSYVPDDIKKMEWFRSVDCSEKIAEMINALNYGYSIGELISGRVETAVKIKKLRKKYETK